MKPAVSRATDPVVAESGFTLIELLISTAIMMIVSGVVTAALLQMTNAQATIWNRTAMHAGVRSATELLQQEVGQAGAIALPADVTLTAGVAVGGTTATVSSVSGMFCGELLIFSASGTGSQPETAHLASSSCVNAATKVITIDKVVDYTNNQLAPSFQYAHQSGGAVRVHGGFVTGIVPPAASPVSFTNGSTASLLKMYGDINADGNMVYNEYYVYPTCICSATCSPSTTTGSLYRNTMALDAATKPALTSAQVILSNVTANPGGTACFQYQMDDSNAYVLDVAITLTVQTQTIDPITKAVQTETKALLNVSPRNVVDTWELASDNAARVQSTPPSIITLIGLPVVVN